MTTTLTSDSEQAGLLEDIIQNPADDAPRLIYADWLEDRGNLIRAEFIRVQIRLAQSDRACWVVSPGFYHDHMRTDLACTNEGKYTRYKFTVPHTELPGPLRVGDHLRFPDASPATTDPRPRQVDAVEVLDAHTVITYRLFGDPAPAHYQSFEDREREALLWGEYQGGITESLARGGICWNRQAASDVTIVARGFVAQAATTPSQWLEYGPETARRHPVEQVRHWERFPVSRDDGFGWIPCYHHPEGTAQIPGLIARFLKRHPGCRTHLDNGLLYYLFDSFTEADAALSHASILWARSVTEPV
jgi:uncharacterized protein (TIGR02996 family)